MRLEMSDGDFFDGSNFQLSPVIEWRANKHWFASLRLIENKIKLASGQFTSRVVAGRVNYAFNSNWAWLNVVPGDNSNDTVSFNSRIRFQPKPNREYFLLFNQTRDRNTQEILDSAIILKASFNLRY